MKNNKNKPKLIVLNGSPGVGKSTLSKRYIDNHPMTLNIDIDHIWWMMGQWQAARPASESQKFKLANAMLKTHLNEGYDVIIAQHIATLEYHRELEQIVEACDATLIEITLFCEENDAIQRCVDRGKKAGYKTGFRPGGILESEGGREKLRLMYQEMIDGAKIRKNMHYVSSVYGAEDDTYTRLLAIVDEVPVN